MVPAGMHEAGDTFLRSLDDLEAALDANAERAQLMKRRIAEIREQRGAGRSYREIVDAGQSPLIVRLLSESGQAFDAAGARVRRAEVRALYDEGMTMEQIAGKFGVTRQRVSNLLRGTRRQRH